MEREDAYTELPLPQAPEDFLARLQQAFDSVAHQAERGVPNHPLVTSHHGRLHLKGVPLSMEPKRPLSAGCPQDFFRGIGMAKRPQFTPQNGVRHGKVIASEHVEMLVSQRR